MGMGPTVGDYHFEGWDLPTKYDWMHTGPGVPAATRVQDAVRNMAQRMIDSGDVVHNLLGGADWSGAAATAAGQAMQRGAGQLTQTAADTAAAHQCVMDLGDSFTAAQHGVPSPNEIPNGLGDHFLDGATNVINAVSPFDVQSPIHQAMAQRRELDQQANQALTAHMTLSRERVDTIPAVTAPAPITVVAQSAAPAGGGGVAPPGWGTAQAPSPRSGGASPTHSTAAGGVPVPSAAPHAGVAGAVGQFSSGGAPVGTGQAGTGSAAGYGPQYGPAATGSAATGAAVGGAAAGLGADEPAQGGALGRSGVQSGTARRSGAGTSAGMSVGAMGRSAASGRMGALGEGTAGRDGSGSFMQPPVGGTGRNGEEDTEHTDRYAQATDHLVGELPLVAPAVIGETPGEEDSRISRALEGR